MGGGRGRGRGREYLDIEVQDRMPIGRALFNRARPGCANHLRDCTRQQLYSVPSVLESHCRVLSISEMVSQQAVNSSALSVRPTQSCLPKSVCCDQVKSISMCDAVCPCHVMQESSHFQGSRPGPVRLHRRLGLPRARKTGDRAESVSKPFVLGVSKNLD